MRASIRNDTVRTIRGVPSATITNDRMMRDFNGKLIQTNQHGRTGREAADAGGGLHSVKLLHGIAERVPDSYDHVLGSLDQTIA